MAYNYRGHSPDRPGDSCRQGGGRRGEERLLRGLRRLSGGVVPRQGLCGAGEPGAEDRVDQQQRVCPQRPQGLREELCAVRGLPCRQHPRRPWPPPSWARSPAPPWCCSPTRRGRRSPPSPTTCCSTSFDSSSSAHTGDMDYAGRRPSAHCSWRWNWSTAPRATSTTTPSTRGWSASGASSARPGSRWRTEAKAFAQEYKNDSFLYTMGSGALLGLRLHGEHLHLHGDAVDPLRLHPHRGVLPRPI